MLGDYSVAGGALRFTPPFPLDPGRPYQVRFDPARLPGAGDSTPRRSSRRVDAGRTRHADDRRDAGLSDRRRRAGEPAADVR